MTPIMLDPARRLRRYTLLGAALFFVAISMQGQSSSGSGATAHKKKPAHSATHKTTHPATHKTTHTAAKASQHAAHARATVHHASAPHTAFAASTELRPMAQQLVQTRSAAAYAGVQNYAHSHTGEAAAAAWLALGHAYFLDKRYADAYQSFLLARKYGVVLDDYAEYLGAQSAIEQGRPADAVSLLNGFGARYHSTVFMGLAPVKLAEAYLALNDPGSALRTLAPYDGQAISAQSEFLYTEARANQAAGHGQQAIMLYHRLADTLPLSSEAAGADTQLHALGDGLSVPERKMMADALFAAKKYNDALGIYRELEHARGAEQGNFAVYAAACELKLKSHWLNRLIAEQLPDRNDDSGALRLYILEELNRSANDASGQANAVQQLQQRFPSSPWLQEALYSAGYGAFSHHDYGTAEHYYTQLFTSFPTAPYAPSSHWRVAWMNYRQRNYAQAARLFEEQIQRYAGGQEIPAALYWRARIYEDEERNYPQARNYYTVLMQCYTNYYYGLLARQRLNVMAAASPTAPAPAPALLGNVKPVVPPVFTDVLPADDEHLEKARLLANAALNEYIPQEIQLSPGSAQWGIFAQASIYQSFGEDYRALQVIKKIPVAYFALPISAVPISYWHLLFPHAFWGDLASDSEANHLDPYFTAALIRQESEFNPQVISHANAYGLMQLLPSVGKQMAKKVGMKGIGANDLLRPDVNLKLGTVYLSGEVSRYNGQQELALAAYNAGDGAVHGWQAASTFKDLPEFVESIPYTETHDYVQSVLRNVEMYRLIYSEGVR